VVATIVTSDIDLLYYNKDGQFKEIESELRKLSPKEKWEPVNQATIHTYTHEDP